MYLALTAIALPGVLVLGTALMSARASVAAGNWPAAKGVITLCSFEPTGSADSHTSYIVRVEYRYEVGARTYDGNRLAIGYSATSNRAAHAQIYEQLRRAKTVNVRYNPRDPNDAVLSFGVHRSIKVAIAASALWIIFVVCAAVLYHVTMGNDGILISNLNILE